MKFSPLLGVMAAILAWTPTAMAQESPGALSASSFQRLPASLVVTVRPLDNSRENLSLVPRFDAALEKRSASVRQGSAPLILNFETEVQPIVRQGTGPSLGEILSNNRGSEVRINLWSTTQDSVLRGRQAQTSAQASVRYVLTATLDDAATGQRLWQGEARYAGGDRDQAQAWAALVPILVEEIGNNVRARAFTLD